MEDIIVYLVIFGLPVAAVIWFVISLILFIRRDKSNAAKCKACLILLIVSAVTAGLLVLAVLALLIMMMLVVSYM